MFFQNLLLVRAVGQSYEEFPQVSDAEVIAALPENEARLLAAIG